MNERLEWFKAEARRFRANELQAGLDTERYNLNYARSRITHHEERVQWAMEEINDIKRHAREEGIELK